MGAGFRMRSGLGACLMLSVALLAGGQALARPLQDSDLPLELRDANIASTLKAHAGPDQGWSEVGEASYYRHTRRFHQTASGERFNENALTAAHHSLPLGTRVRVTDLDNGKSVVVRINDRPADSNPRVIDLARGAAAQLGMMHDGVARVELTIVPQDEAPVEVAEAPDDLDPPIRASEHPLAGHHAVAHHGAHHSAGHHNLVHHSVAHHSAAHHVTAHHHTAPKASAPKAGAQG